MSSILCLNLLGHYMAGAIAVLHTHSRRLDYHLHVHLVMPAGVIDQKKGLWRTKTRSGKKHYLFKHKALAKVFRAKMLHAIAKANLKISGAYPRSWIVNCKFTGNGEKAGTYRNQLDHRSPHNLLMHQANLKTGLSPIR